MDTSNKNLGHIKIWDAVRTRGVIAGDGRAPLTVGGPAHLTTDPRVAIAKAKTRLAMTIASPRVATGWVWQNLPCLARSDRILPYLTRSDRIQPHG